MLTCYRSSQGYPPPAGSVALASIRRDSSFSSSPGRPARRWARAAGHAGSVWFTDTAAQKFGRLDVKTGEFKEYDILALRGPRGLLPTSLGNPLPFPGPIRQGADGKIYFAEGGFQAGNKIGQFDPKTGAFKEHVVPSPAAGICDLNNSQSGAIWFGEFTGNAIGKLDTP